MLYNYVRFEHPFEFGQSYQLTVADQTVNRGPVSQGDILRIVNGIISNYICYAPMTSSFPFLPQESVLLNFPICIAAILCLVQKDTMHQLKKQNLSSLVWVLVLGLLLITTARVAQSPVMLERYRSDLYWIAGIIVFISFATFMETLADRQAKIIGFVFSLIALNTVFRSFLLWSLPYDNSFTSYFPEYLEKFAKVMSFGL